MSKSELNKLMKEVKEGDENSFELLYYKTYKGIFSFIYSYTQNYHTSEDLLQETYIKVKVNAQKYQDNTNVSAWILQIAKNISLDYLRKEKSSKNLELNENISSNEKDISTPFGAPVVPEV